MAAIKLGRNCSINRNTGTYGSPVWSAVNYVKDATLTETKTEADASVRNSGYALTVGTMLEASVDFEIVEDTSDAAWTALNSSYRNSTGIDMAILNGPATSGNKGVRAYFEVVKFDRSEGLTDIVKRAVTIKPTWPTDGNFPVELTI